MGDDGAISPHGFHISGVGQPRLPRGGRTGRSGRAATARVSGVGFRRTRRGPLDPYAEGAPPRALSAWRRVLLDLSYPSDVVPDACGTEADARRRRTIHAAPAASATVISAAAAAASAAGDARGSGGSFRLRVLTQNLWGIPCISECLETRIHAFCRRLAGYDVVALQEVWHARERDALRRAAARAGLRFSRHFAPGCGAPLLGAGSGGTGLMVLSRYCIVESIFQRFAVNGQPHKLSHADYLGAKGVGICRLATPAGAVDVYITHLHAEYDRGTAAPLAAAAAADGSGASSAVAVSGGSGTSGRRSVRGGSGSGRSSDSGSGGDGSGGRGSNGGGDEYMAHRVAQAWQLAQFVQLTAKSPLAMVLGDLNAAPGSVAAGLPRSVAGLSDAYVDCGGSAGPAGHTSDVPANIFWDGAPSERIDYILYRSARSVPALYEPLALDSLQEEPPIGEAAATTATAAGGIGAATAWSVERCSVERMRLTRAEAEGLMLRQRRRRPQGLTAGTGSAGVSSSSRSRSGGLAVAGPALVDVSDHYGVAAVFVARRGGSGGDRTTVSGSDLAGLSAGLGGDAGARGGMWAASSDITGASGPDAGTGDGTRGDSSAAWNGADSGSSFAASGAAAAGSGQRLIDGLPPPLAPLLGRARVILEDGIGEAARRRKRRFREAQVLAAVTIVTVVATGVAAAAVTTRAATGSAAAGGAAAAAGALAAALLAAAASACFCNYWFAARDEENSLREALSSLTNWEKHLPLTGSYLSA